MPRIPNFEDAPHRFAAEATARMQQALPNAPHGRLRGGFGAPQPLVTAVTFTPHLQVTPQQNAERIDVQQRDLSRLVPTTRHTSVSPSENRARDTANAKNISEVPAAITNYMKPDPYTAGVSRAAATLYPVRTGLRGRVLGHGEKA
jgi:hypothetical protein